MCCADIHGRFEALKEVLDKSSFNYDEDVLIILGDIVDGGYDTYQVVEELLKIKNLIFVRGNHDQFFMNHISTGWGEEVWYQQGGANTLRSYGAKVKEANFMSNNTIVDTKKLNIPVTHQDFFNRSIPYYILDGDKIFVHGGFNPKVNIYKQNLSFITWDRNLIKWVRESKKYVPGYKKVFVGHTPFNDGPKIWNNLYCLDTGCGWDGKLTIMDIDTEEYWQSKLQTPAIEINEE